MQIARSVLLLSLALSPIFAVEHPSPKNPPKAAAKEAPPAAKSDAAESRLDRRESRMLRRDKEMDRRLKAKSKTGDAKPADK
jgi:hypothetical protein